jgi:hypothetical protein
MTNCSVREVADLTTMSPNLKPIIRLAMDRLPGVDGILGGLILLDRFDDDSVLSGVPPDQLATRFV